MSLMSITLGVKCGIRRVVLHPTKWKVSNSIRFEDLRNQMSGAVDDAGDLVCKHEFDVLGRLGTAEEQAVKDLANYDLRLKSIVERHDRDELRLANDPTGLNFETDQFVRRRCLKQADESNSRRLAKVKTFRCQGPPVNSRRRTNCSLPHFQTSGLNT